MGNFARSDIRLEQRDGQHKDLPFKNTIIPVENTFDMPKDERKITFEINALRASLLTYSTPDGYTTSEDMIPDEYASSGDYKEGIPTNVTVAFGTGSIDDEIIANPNLRMCEYNLSSSQLGASHISLSLTELLTDRTPLCSTLQISPIPLFTCSYNLL